MGLSEKPVVSSTITTASEPEGILAPVIHWIHSPLLSTKSLGIPAELIPIFFKVTGLSLDAPIVSNERTAKPSIAELLKWGDGNFAIISSDKRRCVELFNWTISEPRRNIFWLIIDLASLTDIIKFFELIK